MATAQKNPGGVTTAQASNGQKAAYNPNTGTVSTTQSSKGGEAKSANGKGVYVSLNGTKCARTANNEGCKK